jgi:hypothetical protein
MKHLFRKINQIVISEIIAALIFGFSYVIVSLLPEDDISNKLRYGILFLYSISAVSLPIIIKYLK